MLLHLLLFFDIENLSRFIMKTAFPFLDSGHTLAFLKYVFALLRTVIE